MTLFLELQNPQRYESVPAVADFEAWANACWLDENDAGVVIRVVDEHESGELNQGFRGKNDATNVLSFQYEDTSIHADYNDQSEVDYLGDLVICQPVIEREALEQGKKPIQHWAHMVVHGLLHLQGFDHIKAIEADIMEAREVDILHGLGFPNPYELG